PAIVVLQLAEEGKGVRTESIKADAVWRGVGFVTLRRRRETCQQGRQLQRMKLILLPQPGGGFASQGIGTGRVQRPGKAVVERSQPAPNRIVEGHKALRIAQVQECCSEPWPGTGQWLLAPEGPQRISRRFRLPELLRRLDQRCRVFAPIEW